MLRKISVVLITIGASGLAVRSPVISPTLWAPNFSRKSRSFWFDKAFNGVVKKTIWPGALDNGYGAARLTCESFCKLKCFFCWNKAHLFYCFTAFTDIGDLAWLRASFFDSRGILMNDQAANWAGRELNLHWGFDELRADRAIHPMDLQGAPKATCVALANSR